MIVLVLIILIFIFGVFLSILHIGLRHALHGFIGIKNIHFFQRICKNIAVVEKPSNWEFFLKLRINFGIFWNVIENSLVPFLLLERISVLLNLILFALLLLLFSFSLLIFDLYVLFEIFDLWDSLLTVFLFELIDVVEYFDEPVKIFFLVQVKDDIILDFALFFNLVFAKL